MSTRVFARELREGDFVQSTFLVLEKVTRASRRGDPYLCLTLGDRSGQIEARVWDDVEMHDGRLDDDDFVAVRGEVESFGGTLYLTIHDLERLDDEAVERADFFPTSRWEPSAMLEQLEALVADHVASPAVRALLSAMLGDETLRAGLLEAPAASSNHHAYLGGLLEHVLSMSRVATGLCAHYEAYYPGLIEADLVIAGCLLHDIGKVWELSYRRAFRYSDAGNLVGHIAMGSELVDRLAERATVELPEDLRLQLKHLVLSHHGKKEYGSPVVPQTPEALLLHQIDMIDSRMNMCWDVARSTDPGGWSSYQRTLGARLYIRGAEADAWRERDQPEPGELAGPGLREQSGQPEQAPAPREDEPNLNLFGD